MLGGLVSRKTVRNMLRYLIMFLSVFIASQYIPECGVSHETAFIMAAVAATSFTLIDMYFPVLCVE